MKELFKKILISVDDCVTITDEKNNRFIIDTGKEKFELKLQSYDRITEQDNIEAPKKGQKDNTITGNESMREHEPCSKNCRNKGKCKRT